MTNTGLYFGSFNPIHIGHMAIAGYMMEFTALDELWFVVSPHNPLKKKDTLLNDQYRLDLVTLATEKDERFRVSDIEFRMPRPSFTIDTLTYLEEKNPGRTFYLIMGADGLKSFDKWKNADLLIQKYHRIIYPRHGVSKNYILSQPNVTLVDAPMMEISSSFIRRSIREGKDMRYFLPPEVYNMIRGMHFYE
ncbi:MAG: nicotinate-nucleotide adenylyltransferase [Bacteroidales bacterium]|nr:nicotinate-nucleotide adenylyltransferase [Bacteroidales bacterium]